MKRWMVVLLAVVCLFGGAAQAAKKAAAPELVTNPLRAATPEEIQTKVGAWMQPPETAALVSWLIIDGQAPLAEMLFMLDGVEYSYRAQAAEGLTDISGMNYAFEPRETVRIGGLEGLVQTSANEEASVGVALWYDDEANLAYSLAMMSDASLDTLLNLADTLYGQPEE